MKKKVMSKEMAARALTILAQEHLKAYPAEERDRRIKAFGSKVAELRSQKEERQIFKPRAASRNRRQARAH
jgi:hypothetical protein